MTLQSTGVTEGAVMQKESGLLVSAWEFRSRANGRGQSGYKLEVGFGHWPLQLQNSSAPSKRVYAPYDLDAFCLVLL